MEPEHHRTFGPFHLDDTQGGLWQGAQAIALRPQSLALLRYLVAHLGFQAATKPKLTVRARQ
jgi:DNA-binding winged helix-turn-helix (wHTH) protein